jgi:WXXGXW repeat (2 copies)
VDATGIVSGWKLKYIGALAFVQKVDKERKHLADTNDTMRHLLKVSVLLGVLFLPAAPAHAQVSFSFAFGTPPPPPRVYRVPPPPGPAYEWVEGYWYPADGRWSWHDGYWTRPPFADSYWIEPYWAGGRYFEGYWYTRRGNYDHDHRWDRDRERDGNRKWRKHQDHDDHGRR